jgi:glycosyltransferase involved in cell wall biosynthesis
MIIGVDASRALRARRTGTERYSLEIIRHLLGLQEASEHTWRLYTDAADLDSRLSAHFPSDVRVEMCVLPARRLWTHHRLAREVTQRRPDVLFVPAHVIPFVMPAGRLPPCVVTVHDLGYRAFPESHPWKQRLYLELTTRWSVHVAQKVIAVSQATAKDLMALYHTPSDRIRVIYEAPAQSAPVTLKQVQATRERYGLERPYALFIGTIHPRKNIARLLQSYQSLSRDGGVAWDLVLAGASGWQSEGFDEQVAGMGLSRSVRWLGYVPDEELPALLKGALFFCFPSLFEGFGLPVLEAQSYGVPVVTSNNSALPEIAGDAALLVDPTDVDAIADAMLRLSQDEALRQRLIEAGYANVKRFSWEKAARETLAVLLEAAKEGRR